MNAGNRVRRLVAMAYEAGGTELPSQVAERKAKVLLEREALAHDLEALVEAARSAMTMLFGEQDDGAKTARAALRKALAKFEEEAKQ